MSYGKASTNYDALPPRSNALIIHYTNNNQIIHDDELVLIDAGCELKCVTPFAVHNSLY